MQAILLVNSRSTAKTNLKMEVKGKKKDKSAKSKSRKKYRIEGKLESLYKALPSSSSPTNHAPWGGKGAYLVNARQESSIKW